MAKQYFIPKKQADYLNWHDTLKGGVTATTPGATATDVTMLTTDNATLHTKLTAATLADSASTAAHADLQQAIAATKTNSRLLAGRIKKSTGYTEVLGKQLNIIGAEDTTDMTQEQPTLSTIVRAAGVVEIDFNKIDAEGVHIYGMRDGETVFTLLASATHARYIDNRPLLVPGKPETRQYKAVFFIGKSEIGLTSDTVTAIAAP
jgi:hypothetical protein